MQGQDNQPLSLQSASNPNAAVQSRLSAIAYSMDALIPGFYLWAGPFKLRLGGSLAEDTYPGTIHSCAGVALVLPGYRIYSTYQGSYDPPCLS